VTTFGEARVDARARAWDAIEVAPGARMAKRAPAPAPSQGAVSVPLPTQPAVKVEFDWTMRDEGVRKAELARRLHWHRPQVDRLLDLDHASATDRLDAAFAELGVAGDVRLRAVPD
jgi:antitoxin HicB